jgi:inner membrane protein
VYWTGHYGVALLAYAPLGFGILLAGHPGPAVAGGAGVLFLTTLPDYDQRVPLIEHRGVTHTVAFAVVVGAALALAATATDLRPELVAFAFVVGALAIGAHLLADWLTPAGIRPFWPLSGRSYSLSATTAANPLANYLLLAAGVLVTVAGLLVLGPGL